MAKTQQMWVDFGCCGGLGCVDIVNDGGSTCAEGRAWLLWSRNTASEKSELRERVGGVIA